MKKIGEMLVESGVLLRDDLEKALAIQSQNGSWRPIGEILVEMNLITIDTLIRYIEIQLREKIKG